MDPAGGQSPVRPSWQHPADPPNPDQQWSRPAGANPSGAPGPRPSHPAGQHAFEVGEQYGPNKFIDAFLSMRLNPPDPNQQRTRPAGANPSSVHGPRPSHQAGRHAFAVGEQCVPNQFVDEFNSLTSNPPNPTWYMDTGATSHMTNMTGFLRAKSDTPPTHHTVKVEGFASLVVNNVQKYTTGEFEAGGYKWRLILYPTGNKSRNGNGNISVYLKMVEESLPHQWSEVHASFGVFLFDQNNGNYYTLHDAHGKCFNRMKLEWGFDQFMPLHTFRNPSNGYLVDDTCVFGAEVYVHKENIRGKGEHLVMSKYVNSYKHTWKIDAFSRIATKDRKYSPSFGCGGFKWMIEFHPKGYRSGRGNHISVYLSLADAAGFSIATQIYAKYTIRIVDQLYEMSWSCTVEFGFDKSTISYGWPKFIPLNHFNDPSNGYLVNDKCIIEAEVTVLGVTTAL